MPSSSGVWGIDIGQCALKALRCSKGEEGTIVADAFDFIEYPKILSQPEADPDELIREALKQFLSRNDVRGDKVAISVSGQAGLARFIKLPPVESKKIPDIVKYEARQQIPFPLDEVIWDYQQLAGGSEEEGFTLETEVGLFAMKRDQVFKVIRPFDRADIELDIIQLAPLAMYNVVCHDYLTDLPPPEEYDPDDPPESVVVISLGTDTTDLVVTNGYRVWQRNIPLGGNHFTRALSKEMKLTFAKAEHLKRNARDAEDPKKVFQAMRPVFNDLVTEVQRSISYFQSIDRRAKIGKVIALGNAMRLPGLQQYLSKNLGYDVFEVNGYPKLQGKGVIGAPAFRENLLSYAVCYGLCLQGLGKGALSTNLLPRELVIQRMVREKKPWALATVAVLLGGLAINFLFINSAWKSVNVKRDDYQAAFSKVKQVTDLDTAATSTDAELYKTAQYLESLGNEVVDNSERRLFWPELYASLNTTLPWDKDKLPSPDFIAKVNDLPLDARQDLHITKVESKFFPDLATWYTPKIQEIEREDKRAVSGGPAAAPAAEPAEGAQTPAAGAGTATDADASASGPTGQGWVIELQGYHDFAIRNRNQGAQYVRRTLLTALEKEKIELPIAPGSTKTAVFTLKEVGISNPVMVWNCGPPKLVTVPNPNYEGGKNVNVGEAGIAEPDGEQNLDQMPSWEINRFYFIVQFAVKEKTPSARMKEREGEGAATAGGNQVAARGS